MYEINFDYLTYISSSKNVKGTYLNRRNYDINFVLTPMQYSKFYKADYFYTPVKWDNGVVLKVYSRYPDRSKMYYHAPLIPLLPRRARQEVQQRELVQGQGLQVGPPVEGRPA